MIDSYYIDPESMEEFVAWREPWISDQPLNLWDFMFHESSVALAAAHATLFWPTFHEIDGCVLLRGRGQQGRTETWMRSLGGDRSRVEAVINHIHMYSLFREGTGANGADAAVKFIGEIMRRTWAAALSEAFPEREFVVDFGTDDDGSDPTITFWQVRNDADALS